MPRRGQERSGVLAAVLLVCATVHAAQVPSTPARDGAGAAPASPATARLRGRIIAADTAQPLGRAQVTLSGPTLQPPRRTLTDAEGRYEFAALPAGTYSVSTTRTGYVSLQYGQRRPFEPGRTVSVAAGQTLDRIDVALPRGSVIVARVTDDLGFPVSGVQVRAHRFQYRDDGQRTLVPVYAAAGGPMQTDDRGEIRLFGLMPGEYVVGAVLFFGAGPSGDPNAGEGFAPTFYPGVSSAGQAAAVSVGLGEETAVQFPLVRSRLARVSGVVVDGLGRPANGARVSLAPATPQSVTLGANAMPDGSFVIGSLAPDEYAVLTTFNGVDDVAAVLTIDGEDVSDLRITVGPGTTVSGRVVFEGGVPPADRAASMRVVLASLRGVASPAVSGQRAAPIDGDGRFGFAGMSGRIVTDVTAPDGWMLKSVAIDGQDVTNQTIDLARRATLPDVVITMTNRLTTVSGRVTDARAQLLRDYTVVIVPMEAYEAGVMARRVRVARPDPEGTFSTRGMLPGAYAAIAVETLETGRQYSPELQQQVRRRGVEFMLREGETATLTLSLTPDL